MFDNLWCLPFGFVKFFPTAEESVNHYNQKRSVDGKGLILPSQLVSVPSLWLVLKMHDGTSFVYL
jgi:hypothetical protein